MAKMTRTELIEALADRYKEGGWVGVADGVQDLTGETLPEEQVYQFDLRIQAPTQALAQALADMLLQAAEHDESLKVTYALRDSEPIKPGVVYLPAELEPLPAVIQWDDRNELKNLPVGTRYRSPIRYGYILWEVLPDGFVAPINSNTGELQPSRWDPDMLGHYAFPLTLDYPEEG